MIARFAYFGLSAAIVSSLVAMRKHLELANTTNGPPTYHLARTIAIGRAGDGRVAQRLTMDSVHRRLYGLGHLVFDVDRDRVVDSVPGEASTYVIAPDLGVGLTGHGLFFDLGTLQVRDTVAIEGIAGAYDPKTQRAFVGGTYDQADTITVVDMRTRQIVKRVPIARDSDYTIAEPGVADGTGALFVAEAGRAAGQRNWTITGALTRVDATTLAISAQYRLADCEQGGARDVSMDTVHHRVFVACQAALTVVDADSGTVVARIQHKSAAEQNAFDPATQLIFSASAADSTITIIHEDTPNCFTVVGTFGFRGSVDGVAVDPKTHKAYVFYGDAIDDQGAGGLYVVHADGSRERGWQAQMLYLAVLEPSSTGMHGTRPVGRQ